MYTHNVAFVGSAGVGKTRFLEKYLDIGHDRQFPQKQKAYVPTVGVEVHPYPVVDGTVAKAVVNFWDCAGNVKFIPGNLDEILNKTDTIVVVHDGDAEKWAGNIEKKNKEYILLDMNTIKNTADANNWILNTLV